MAYIDANDLLEKDMQNQIESMPAGEHYENVYAVLGTLEPEPSEMGETVEQKPNRPKVGSAKSRAAWCHVCGVEFRACHPSAMFCSEKCRNENNRWKRKVKKTK